MIKRRYHYVFLFLRPFFRLYMRLAYNYHGRPAPSLRPDQPALILANHNAAFDPFFMAVSFKRPIFYVASDHIFRLGWISSVIRALVSPIPIVKSQMDLRTLRTIRETIQAGGLVGLFPEGNRSFNGVTAHMMPSVGKLVKQLNCTLILYRIEGAYLATPRWSLKKRRGLIRGEVVRQLEPDELARMTPDEIYRIIVESLQVDAFADQLKKPIRFTGKRLAENLELALFVCPKCHHLATLSSQDDIFSCDCGLAVRYTPPGFFEPVDTWSKTERQEGRFLDTVAAWDAWQRKILVQLPADSSIIDMSGARALFADDDQRLYDCERASRSIKIATGRLSMFADRLEFQSVEGVLHRYPLDEISRMIVHGPKTLQFATSQGIVLEVRSKIKRSALKYMMLYHLLEQIRKGEPHGFFGL